MFVRILGASHGSGCGMAGQTPSFRPPRIIRSICCNRASRTPKMNSRGCPPYGGRTATESSNCRSIGPASSGSIIRVAASPDASSPASRSAAARPSAPLQACSPAMPATISRRSAAKADNEVGPRSACSTRSRAGRTLRQASPQPRVLRSLSFSAQCASIPASPSGGRGPRRARSSRRALSSQARRSPACPASGCFTSASVATGARRSAAAAVMPSSRVPTGAWDNGLPALSSAWMPQRCSRADTREASSRSGVTSAAVLLGVSSTSRMAIAMACASAAGSGSSA